MIDFRAGINRIRSSASDWRERFHHVHQETTAAPHTRSRATRMLIHTVHGVDRLAVGYYHLFRNGGTIRKTALGSIAFLAAAVPAYWLIGQFSGTVNNKELVLDTPSGGSAIVETMARMHELQLNQTGWCPSGSPFSPGHIRHDTCGFQEGIQSVTVKVVQELQNHTTREGSASSSDPDINKAVTAFSRGNQWAFLWGNSTYHQYWYGVGYLDHFNKRMANKQANIYPRIDTLSSMTANIASILGDEVIRIKQASDEDATFSFQARTDFFHGLGVMYATCAYLKAVNVDFKSVIDLQSAQDVYSRAAASACTTLNLMPTWPVTNGRGYGLWASHLRTLYGDISNANQDLSYAQNGLAAGSVQHLRR